MNFSIAKIFQVAYTIFFFFLWSSLFYNEVSRDRGTLKFSNYSTPIKGWEAKIQTKSKSTVYFKLPLLHLPNRTVSHSWSNYMTPWIHNIHACEEKNFTAEVKGVSWWVLFEIVSIYKIFSFLFTMYFFPNLTQGTPKNIYNIFLPHRTR